MLRRKLLIPIMKFLQQGMTPQKMALAVALGLAFGAFPVIGPTTFLCFLAAIAFRVNVAAVQLVNYISYPFQIICLVPFYKTGAWLFGDEAFKLSVNELMTMISSDFIKALTLLWNSMVYAVIVWTMVAPVFIFLVYFAMIPLFKRIIAKKKLTDQEMV